MKQATDSFPDEVNSGCFGTGQGYLRVTGLFAVFGSYRGEFEEVQTLIDRGDIITVCRGELSEAATRLPDRELGPVYALEGTGPPAVPTGRFFVRFEDGTSIADMEPALREAGFAIVQPLAGTRSAGWVAALSGRVADGLARAKELLSVPGLVTAEPQMLMERATRSSLRRPG